MSCLMIVTQDDTVKLILLGVDRISNGNNRVIYVQGLKEGIFFL